MLSCIVEYDRKYPDNVLRFGPLFSWNRGPKLVSEASLFNWLMFPIIKGTHVYSLAIESIYVTGQNRM